MTKAFVSELLDMRQEELFEFSHLSSGERAFEQLLRETLTKVKLRLATKRALLPAPAGPSTSVGVVVGGGPTPSPGVGGTGLKVQRVNGKEGPPGGKPAWEGKSAYKNIKPEMMSVFWNNGGQGQGTGEPAEDRVPGGRGRAGEDQEDLAERGRGKGHQRGVPDTAGGEHLADVLRGAASPFQYGITERRGDLPVVLDEEGK